MRKSPLHISALRIPLAMMAVLMLLPLLHGCGGGSRIHRGLLHAESIMEEHPDSAYSILSAIRPDSGDSEEDRALHALLLTQSMHKTRILDTVSIQQAQSIQSELESAISIFEKKDMTQRLIRAYYFRDGLPVPPRIQCQGLLFRCL